MKPPTPQHLIVVAAVISAAAAGAVALTAHRTAPPLVHKGDLAGPRPVPRVALVIPIDRPAQPEPPTPGPLSTETTAVNLTPAPPSTETTAVDLTPAPPSTETTAVNQPPGLEPPSKVDEPPADPSPKRVEIAHIGEGDMCSRHGNRRFDFKRGRRMFWRCVYDKQ
jgi:hypothetical protein